jgi:hypothetical protein
MRRFTSCLRLGLSSVPGEMCVEFSSLTVLLNPARGIVMISVRRHYGHAEGEPASSIPLDLTERHWYHSYVHDQRAEWQNALLLLKVNQRIIIIVVSWYLSA